jgi:hypothetical protein
MVLRFLLTAVVSVLPLSNQGPDDHSHATTFQLDAAGARQQVTMQNALGRVWTTVFKRQKKGKKR